MVICLGLHFFIGPLCAHYKTWGFFSSVNLSLTNVILSPDRRTLDTGKFFPSLQHILFIHAVVDRHLRCFHFLCIINNAAMSIRYLFGSGISESYGHSLFNLLRSFLIFQREDTILLSHQQCRNILIALYPHEYIFFLICLCDCSHPAGCEAFYLFTVSF